MKRGSDGTAAVGEARPVGLPGLHALPLHRLLLNDEPVVETVALGNDGTIVQRSATYWAITACGAGGLNGVALQIPDGCRGPVSLMNNRAVARCAGGLAVLDTSRQAILSIDPEVVSVHQLFESDVIVVRFSTHITALYPDGTEMPLPSSSTPASVAHDSTYQTIDVTMDNHARFRFDETMGWFPVTLPGPREAGATLCHYNVKSGASVWLDGAGNVVVYHLGEEPMVRLPSGHGALVTSSPTHIFVLNDTAVYPSVVPEISLVDAFALTHAGTLFPDQIMGMARVCDSDIGAVHYPYVLWRNALFEIR